MTSPSKHWRVAIIGAGTVVQRAHIPNFQSVPNASIRAICDANVERAQVVAQEAGIAQVYKNYELMLREIQPDITVIATPNIFHKPMTLAALESGSHVLCEKPLTLTYADAQEMVKKAVEKELVLNVGTPYRWSDPMRACKAHVDAGFFGEIYAVQTTWHRRSGIPGFGSWFTNRSLAGGGSLLDIGIHALDRALFLMDFPTPISVSGATFGKLGSRGLGLGTWGVEIYRPDAGVLFDVDDLAWAFIRFDNGMVLQFQVSWAVNFKEQFVTALYGTEGGAQVGHHDDVELYTTLNGQNADVQISVPRSPLSMYTQLVHNFVRYLDGDATAEVITPEQALNSVRIIEAIQHSSESGQEIRLDHA
jgi:predicted dehydrogenase